MATFYLDPEGGNDANDGTTFANRWKTFASGATAARTSPGDTIRVMASPDETLIGNATWTDLSKTITLAGAATANISDCETAWTASANVTATASTGNFKENAKSASLAIAGAFTTGKAAYFATGTLDLSGYQQVSFWIYTDVAIAASTLSLRLCTDTTGGTSVHTIAIPAINVINRWIPITVDVGGALNSAIASIALYQDSDIAAVTVLLDNIIACKAASSAGSLSLTSLIGKVWNLSWVASTSYASNAIRIPKPPNRNGYRYKVTAGGGGNSAASEPTWPQEIGVTVTDGALTWTCEGLEDTWYGIQSINGVTVKLDNDTNCLGNAGKGYSGATETVSTYKRETIKPAMLSQFTAFASIQEAGTAGNNITYQGGWNRTDMATQTGQTWVDLQHGYAYFCKDNLSVPYITFDNINSVRTYTHIDHTYITPWQIKNSHGNNCSGTGFANSISTNGAPPTFQGVCCMNGAGTGFSIGGRVGSFVAASAKNSISYGINISGATSKIAGRDVVVKNNTNYGVLTNASSAGPIKFTGLITADNGLGLYSNTAVQLINCSLTDATPIAGPGSHEDTHIYSQKHGQTANNHLITTDGGTIISATDQRHTASGISWKFRPTSANRNSAYPLKLSVAKIAVAAGVAKTVAIWTRRDSTNIKGLLCIDGGQVAGVPVDISVACEPSINTWVLASNLTFTPTEAGVVEVFFRAFDGVGTTNAFWIDDISIV